MLNTSTYFTNGPDLEMFSKNEISLFSGQYSSRQRQSLVKRVANTFQKYIAKYLEQYLESFYLVGSFVSGEISLDRPDINYLLIFKGATSPKNYLAIGQITQAIEAQFAPWTSIRVEFRPFRYILPHYPHNFEISLNPIIISTTDITEMGSMIFSPWFTQALRSNNKLLFGRDYLKSLSPPLLNRQILRRIAPFDLSFFTLPLSRAPAQYTFSQTPLFLSEALINAKNLAYLGVEAAMSDAELSKNKYLNYIHHKNKLVEFYKDRYSLESSKMIASILETRRHYLRYKYNSQRTQEIFSIALNLASFIRLKLNENL